MTVGKTVLNPSSNTPKRAPTIPSKLAQSLPYLTQLEFHQNLERSEYGKGVAHYDDHPSEGITKPLTALHRLPILLFDPTKLDLTQPTHMDWCKQSLAR